MDSGRASPTINAKLRVWVDEMAGLCRPSGVVWVDGSEEEYDRLCQTMVDAGTLHPAQPRKTSEFLPGPLATLPMSRGSRTGPSSAPSARMMRDRPTTGLPRRDAATLVRSVRRLHARAARCTSSPSAWGRSARRLPRSACSSPIALCRRQHAHHDAHGQAGARRARRRWRLRAVPAFGRRAARSRAEGRPLALRQRQQIHRPLPRERDDLVLRLGLWRQRACWARNASRCASPRSWRREKAGSPSTC